MRKAGLFLTIAGALWLAACSAERIAPVVATPPASDKARLYIYRDATTYGSQNWTSVSLSGGKIGDTAPGTVFYRDVAPGTYELEVRSDRLYPNQFKAVTLAPGSITFVKVEEARSWSASGMGAKGTTFVIRIVDPATGTSEISQLPLVGG